MTNGDNEMTNMIEVCSLFVDKYQKTYPYVTKNIDSLIKYIKAFDKNQKSLIKLLLKYKRENEILSDLVRHNANTMTEEIKYISDVWTGGNKE